MGEMDIVEVFPRGMASPKPGISPPGTGLLAFNSVGGVPESGNNPVPDDEVVVGVVVGVVIGADGLGFCVSGDEDEDEDEDDVG